MRWSRLGTWNLENLYRPGGQFGPATAEAYGQKLAAIADTIARLAPDVLGAGGSVIRPPWTIWSGGCPTQPDRR